MRVLGIDPGQSGGLAVVSRDAKGVVLHGGIMMPLMSQGKKPTMDWWRAHDFFVWHGVKEAVIESVHAMPRQGVSSSFQFGRMFGAVEMLAEIAQCPLYVTPRAWKKHYGLSSDKGQSLDMATDIFGTDKYWKLKKHEGIAEAALIALYGLGIIEKDT